MATASSPSTRATVHPHGATPRDSSAHEPSPGELPTWEAFFAWQPDVIRHTKTKQIKAKASFAKPRDVQAIMRELGMDLESSRMMCGEKACKGLVVSGRAVRNEYGEWRVVAKFHHNQKCRSEHRRLRHSREMHRLLREVAMRPKCREATVPDDPDEIDTTAESSPDGAVLEPTVQYDPDDIGTTGRSSPDGAVLEFNADSDVSVDDGIDDGFDELSDVDSEGIRLIETAFPDPHDGLGMRRMVAAIIIIIITLAALVATKSFVPAPPPTKQPARFSLADHSGCGAVYCSEHLTEN